MENNEPDFNKIERLALWLCLGGPVLIGIFSKYLSIFNIIVIAFTALLGVVVIVAGHRAYKNILITGILFWTGFIGLPLTHYWLYQYNPTHYHFEDYFLKHTSETSFTLLDKAIDYKFLVQVKDMFPDSILQLHPYAIHDDITYNDYLIKVQFSTSNKDHPPLYSYFIIYQNGKVKTMLRSDKNKKLLDLLNEKINIYTGYVQQKSHPELSYRMEDFWIESILGFSGDITPISRTAKSLHIVQLFLMFLSTFIITNSTGFFDIKIKRRQ